MAFITWLSSSKNDNSTVWHLGIVFSRTFYPPSVSRDLTIPTDQCSLGLSGLSEVVASAGYSLGHISMVAGVSCSAQCLSSLV